jgi:predicted dehydrogenase
MTDRCTRREALQRMAAPAFVPAAALGLGGRTAPNEKIRLGAIGLNGMGQGNLKNCASQPDVVVTALCDVFRKRRDAVLEAHKATARGYEDYRELLGSKDVDAVIIATPPHWHALMAIHAVEAGKDIYLQKPMSMYPDETLAIRNAVNRHKRVSQVGTQVHASPNYHKVVDWVRSGRLGTIGAVRTFNVLNQGKDGLGTAPKQDPPPGMNWDLWLGPAPAIPYNSILAANSFNHAFFWDYSGGHTLGYGPHIVDLPVWALELGPPLTTFSSGGRHAVGGDGDAPDTQEAIWQYPKVTMTWMMSFCSSFGFDDGRGELTRRLGVYFHGLNGTLFSNYGKHQVVPEGRLLQDLTPPPESVPPSPGHEREWLDCIKSRKEPSCNVNYHANVSLALTLANLSYQLGRSIRFDPKAEKISGDEEAARKARPVYRDPYKFPAEYL